MTRDAVDSCLLGVRAMAGVFLARGILSIFVVCGISLAVSYIIFIVIGTAELRRL